MKINKKITVVLSVTGITAFLLQIFGSFIHFPFYILFGDMWMSHVRQNLIDAGLSRDFVARYISFALLNVPVWLVLVIITFCLGLSVRKRTTYAALALSIWMPIMDFVYTALYCMLDSSMELMWPSSLCILLFSFNIRIVSFCGFILGVLGWCFGHGLRTLIGKRDNTRHERGIQPNL